MTNPTKIVIDCSTGIEEVIELTDEEVAEMEAAAVEAEKARKAEEKAAAALQAKKQEVLTKLGLTADEVTALLA